jgi:hypothetical protein
MDSLELDGSGLFNLPLASVTPFSYRDNISYLQKLEYLAKWMRNSISIVEQNISTVQQNDGNAITSLIAQLNSVLNHFVSEWDATLQGLQDSATVLDPVNGVRNEPLNRALGNMYDNLRYYAYFADQLDAFQYTAAEWDAMQYTARHFDLALAYSPTTTQATDIVPSTVTPN